jgi:predicted Zn finger-like uncharacterized protein
MAKFLTQCPFCQTSFKVSEEQMQAANGVVRCGACREVFLAGKNRIVLKDKADDDPGTPLDADLPEATLIEDTPEEEPDFSSEKVTPFFSPCLTADEAEEFLEPEDSFQPIESIEPEESEQFTEPDLLDMPEITTSPTENSDEESIASFDKNFQELKEEDDQKEDLPIESSFSQEEQTESKESAPPASWENFDDPDASAEEDNTETSEQEDEKQDAVETGKESVAAPEEQPEFATFLNPYGYTVQKLSMDCNLPDDFKDSANEDDTPEAEAEAEKIESENQADIDQINVEPEETQYVSSFPIGDDHSLNVPETEEDISAKDSKEEPDEPEAEIETTAPALSPDLVAHENIPILTENQTLDWLQPLRHPAPHFEHDAEENTSINAAVDEKSIIHSNLSALTDEDSLGPLAAENLEAIDEQPVELTKLFDPLKNVKKVALGLLSIALLITLAGQFLWLNLSELSQDERFDLITGPLCNYADCPDRTRVDLSALITEELIIRSHPDVEDALQVDFIFRNDADREQRFPLVELNFTNINGNIIANRVFTPEEYLPAQMHLFTHMPAHSSIQVNLELVDPGEDSTGYSLLFRNP